MYKENHCNELKLSNGMVFNVRGWKSNGMNFCEFYTQADLCNADYKKLLALFMKLKSKKNRISAKYIEFSESNKVLQEVDVSLGIHRIQIMGEDDAEIIPTRVEFIGLGRLRSSKKI